MPAVAAPPPPTRPVVRPPRVSRIYHFDPLLTDSEPDRSSFRRKLLVGSAIAHVLLFFVIAILPTPKTIAEPSLPLTVTFTTEPPRVAEYKPPAPLPKPTPPPVPKAEPKPEPKPVVKEAIPEPAPAPRAEAPKAAPVPAPAPPKPVPVVKTEVFGGAAVGPPVVTGKSSRTVVAVFGDEVAPRAAGAVRRDRVAEVGFDDAPADAAPKRAGAPGIVKSSAFDAQAEAAPAAPKRERPALGRLDAEVEVLSKPRPAYTEEARRLHLEGDVVLNVTFQANGKLLVLGVASGLGHGLDEAAIDAAKKIEFNPARRDGQPVDHTATLRVVFRLA